MLPTHDASRHLGSRIQRRLLCGLLTALLGAGAAMGADLAAVKAPGTPPPDPRPAPGPLGGSGSGRWQWASPVGLFVVDPAVGEIALQGATPGAPPLVTVVLDRHPTVPPPSDTTVTLNGVKLIPSFGSPTVTGSFTVDPAGPQPTVGSGGFIQLVVSSASAGVTRSLVLPCPSDVSMTSVPAIGSSLGGHSTVQVGFASNIYFNPTNPPIPAIAGGPFPTATLESYDPNTGRISGPNGVALIASGALSVNVPVAVLASTPQYLMDVRWPGFWQADGETGGFCGLAKRWEYLNTSCPAIALAPATLPQGTVSSAYAGVTFTSAGGAGTVAIALLGTLPAGMSFNAATATLGGTPTQAGSFPITVTATDANGCTGSHVYTLTISSLPGVPVAQEQVVPVVLKVTGIGTIFTSELTLANTGTAPADLTLTYTSETAIASGTQPFSWSVAQRVEAGQQLAIPDAIAFLKGKGIPLSAEDVGTLLVSYSSAAATPTVFAQARTTSPSGIGRAGVGYGAPATGSLSASKVAVYGLRQNASDRSNMAILNASSSGPATFHVTLISGDQADSRQFALPDVTLQAGEWRQLNGVLGQASPPMTNGYATVERISGTSPFVAYGVINDNGTNDGSFIEMSSATLPAEPVVVPAVVETPVFDTELTLANPGTSPLAATLSYVESLSAAGVGATPVTVLLAPGEQRVFPGLIDFLRTQNAGIGPVGTSHAGSLTVAFSVAGFPAAGWAGARVTAAAPGTGRYGVSYAGVPRSAAASTEAFVTGLRQDGATRSNLALVNVGDAGGSLTLTYDVFDGVTMLKAGSATVTLPPGGWFQKNGVLADFGVANGYVHVVKVSGADRFIAYGVVNDGGTVTPGTNDGSVVTMAGAR